MNINEKLIQIQTELKAPKGQYNSFGKYNYRSCEDILEAVKPLLKELNVSLTLSDEIVNVGDRYYVKATATLTDSENYSTDVTAYAREEENKKGMDSMQLTGATSSYARKYALNGLFAIDDNKDSDDPNLNGDNNKDNSYYSIKSKYELIVEKEIRDWKKADFDKWYKGQQEKYKPQQIDTFLTKILREEQ